MVRVAPTNRKAILFATFIAFGFLFGYDIGVISGCLIMPDFIRRFGQPDGNGGYVLTSSRQSIITSLLSAGGALGQAFTSDRFGRRGSIFIWSAIFTVGTAVQTGTAYSVAQITLGRFIAGLGVGALSGMLYNGETAPKALRGSLLVLYQLQIIMGIFLSYIIDLATHAIPNSASWRVPVGLQMVWGLILLSGIFFIPESPRHLLGIDKRKEAKKVVAELNSVPEDDALVEEIIEELEFGIRAENEGGKATWLECFSTRNKLWKRTLNGNDVAIHSATQRAKFLLLSPYVIQTILGAVSVVGTVPALVIIETWGRRRSLLTGALLEAACSLIGLSGHFTLAPSGTPKDQLTLRNKRGGDTLIAFAVLHVFSFSMFWGPTPYGIALGSATNWIWNFLLSFFAPRIAAKIGPLILMIFFGMLMFGYGYVYLFLGRMMPWKSAGWKPHLNDELRAKSGRRTLCGR
ncbi:general substrate transporter [Amanita rubescens]|nr:general substrate transporter [Amanita rubescens]